MWKCGPEMDGRRMSGNSEDSDSVLNEMFMREYVEDKEIDEEMRRARSLGGLHRQNHHQEDGEAAWIGPSSSSSPADKLSWTKSVSSDGEQSNSSMTILEDLQSSSEASPSTSRTMKFWRSFKKKTKKFRSFSRDRVDKLRSSSDGLNATHWDSSPTSLVDIRLCNGHKMAASTDDDSEDRHSALDAKSLKGQMVAENDDALLQQVKAVDSKLMMLRSLPFFAMDIVLKEGKDLVVRDLSGTSDPYVRFLIGGKQYYRSRTVFKNLSPKWDERFSLPIEDPFQPIQVQVFDYDRGLNDDPMGMASIHPTQLDLNVPTDFKLMLTDRLTKRKKSSEYMGYLMVNCTLIPKSQVDKEQYTGRMVKFVEHRKRQKTQLWTSIVNVLLIDGSNLLSMDDNGFSDPYVKFRLGNERYKSKYKPKTLSPKWLEQFHLYMYEDQTSCLEIAVWDHDTGGRDDIMGRAAVDLSILERDKTHSMDVELEDGAGLIHLLITITGIASYHFNGTSATTDGSENSSNMMGFLQSFKNLRDVGCLQVKVMKAKGLAAADIGGKSDPYCVLELVNDRVQTCTEYKTLSPSWGKAFTFSVRDIHSVLEVSVYDEDPDKKSDFLGKVAIPLLKIHNRRKRWYQLKDQKLTTRMKGAIKLELGLSFNHFKAAIRTFNPKEEKFLVPEPRFRVSVMKHNIDRVTGIVRAAIDVGKFVHSCFDWENKMRSALAFIIFLIVVLNFELYMLPLTLLIIFLKNLLVIQVGESILKDKSQDNYVTVEGEEVDDERENKEEKKSFKEKLQAIQEACLQVQEIMDQIASMGERIKNSFEWAVPWLSWLAVLVLVVATIVLFCIPLRYLVLLWGINKFTKKLRAPDSIPNNELLDYLSRVPSDKELLLYREFRPDPVTTVRKKKQ